MRQTERQQTAARQGQWGAADGSNSASRFGNKKDDPETKEYEYRRNKNRGPGDNPFNQPARKQQPVREDFLVQDLDDFPQLGEERTFDASTNSIVIHEPVVRKGPPAVAVLSDIQKERLKLQEEKKNVKDEVFDSLTAQFATKRNLSEMSKKFLLLIMRGPPGSGKTTFVNAFATQLQEHCLANDLVLDGYIEGTDKYFQEDPDMNMKDALFKVTASLRDTVRKSRDTDADITIVLLDTCGTNATEKDVSYFRTDFPDYWERYAIDVNLDRSDFSGFFAWSIVQILKRKSKGNGGSNLNPYDATPIKCIDVHANKCRALYSDNECMKLPTIRNRTTGKEVLINQTLKRDSDRYAANSLSKNPIEKQVLVQMQRIVPEFFGLPANVPPEIPGANDRFKQNNGRRRYNNDRDNDDRNNDEAEVENDGGDGGDQ